MLGAAAGLEVARHLPAEKEKHHGRSTPLKVETVKSVWLLDTLEGRDRRRPGS
jgi:hypothetical protein